MDEKQIRNIFRENSTGELIELVEEQPQLLEQQFGPPHDLVNFLRLAVVRNDLILVKRFLELGAKPVSEDSSGVNLFKSFLYSGTKDIPPNTEILVSLLEKGFYSPTDNRTDCRHIVYALSSFLLKEHLESFEQIADLGLDILQLEKCARMSVLLQVMKDIAWENDQMKLVKFLLEKGCSATELEGDFDSIATVAIKGEYYKELNIILDQGPEKLKPHSLYRTLTERYEYLPKRIRNKLIGKVDLDYAEVNGKTLLQMAVSEENIDLLDYLIAIGGDVNQKDKDGLTLLVQALSGYYLCKKSAAQLIKLGAEVNAIDASGMTALNIVNSKVGLKQLSNLLIKKGAKTRMELAGKEKDTASGTEIPIPIGAQWASKALSMLTIIEASEVSLWSSLIQHCLDNNGSKPSAKWLREASKLVEEIGDEKVRKYLLEWFSLVWLKSEDNFALNDIDDTKERHTRILKGLIWVSSRYDDTQMCRTLRTIAFEMYKKLKGGTMRNAKLANAVLYSFSNMSSDIGIQEISTLSMVIRHTAALNYISRAFEQLAIQKNYSQDQLAESVIHDYGLTDFSKYQQQFGDYLATVSVVSVGKCKVSWEKDGKPEKNISKTVEQEYVSDFIALKEAVSDIQSASRAYSFLMEKLYTSMRTLDYKTWSEKYQNSFLAGGIGRKLIWRATANTNYFDVLFTESGYVTSDSNIVDIPKDTKISLWHPSMSSAKQVLAWRELLAQLNITQPFKQAHREVYLITDAEKKSKFYSRRFSDHILMQSQFNALAMQRGWKQKKGGNWQWHEDDKDCSAVKSYQELGLDVRFRTQGATPYGETSSGMYRCVATENVYVTKESKKYNLAKINSIVFSEILRDIDLFVSVSSIGIDPNWEDRDDENWKNTSFGKLTEIAKMRKAVLESLIPKLKMAKKLDIEGRFLLVTGKLRTYKIHLGSSNILMQPNDEYLCIVVAKKSLPIALPFEGDTILSLILSKAMMLIDEDSIEDKTILSQIHKSD